MEKERNVLDILLGGAKREAETKEIKIKSLSKLYGEDVNIKIQSIPYDEVDTISDSVLSKSATAVEIVLAGVISPNLRDEKLLAKYGAPTPKELIKKLFLAGEIVELQYEIEKLSGYRVVNFETIKKK